MDRLSSSLLFCAPGGIAIVDAWLYHIWTCMMSIHLSEVNPLEKTREQEL
jgi:hypothetical protein